MWPSAKTIYNSHATKNLKSEVFHILPSTIFHTKTGTAFPIYATNTIYETFWKKKPVPSFYICQPHAISGGTSGIVEQ